MSLSAAEAPPLPLEEPQPDRSLDNAATTLKEAPVVPSEKMESLVKLNWEGKIPVMVSLAATSNVSPTLPDPIFCLVSRQTFLHLGLESAYAQFQEYALESPLLPREQVANGSTEEGNFKTPVLVQDDEDSDDKAPVSGGARPYAPTSVGYRRVMEPAPGTISNSRDAAAAAPPLQYSHVWFQDTATGQALRWHLFVGVLYDLQSPTTTLPWQITMHFQPPPLASIVPLPLDPSESAAHQVRRYYRHGLKQALALAGPAAVVRLLFTREVHEQLWQAVVHGQYDVYHAALPPTTSWLHHVGRGWIPVRLYHHYDPPRQKPARANLTLGQFLAERLPQHFESTAARHDGTVWCLGGLRGLPLTTPLAHLWQALRHADQFLYVVVHTE
jgi:Autophagy protein Apg5